MTTLATEVKQGGVEDDLHRLLMGVLKEINQGRENPIDLELGKAIVLFGRGAVFDSMGLVSFLSRVEEEIEDRLDQVVSLTSEKAVSRRQSPFASVQALIEFIVEELAEQEAAK